MIEVIKDASGRKIGSVDRDNQGNEIVKDFYGRVVARYTKSTNQTRDFYGRLVAWGNVASGLLIKDIIK